MEIGLGCPQQAFADIFAGDIGDAADLFFQPQVAGIVELQQGRLVGIFLADGIDDQPAAGREMAQDGDDGPPGGRGVDYGIQQPRRRLIEAAGPVGAEAEGEGAFISAAGEDIKATVGQALAGQLQHQMRRCAEAAETKRRPILFAIQQAGQPQGTETDSPGAKQGRRLGIAERLRYGVNEISGDDHFFGIAAIDIAAGGPETGAQAFLATKAMATLAAGVEYPGDPDPITDGQALDSLADGIDAADHLMARNDRQVRRYGSALDLIQFGMADAADQDAQAHLAGTGRRNGDIHRLQRPLMQGTGP